MSSDTEHAAPATDAPEDALRQGNANGEPTAAQTAAQAENVLDAASVISTSLPRRLIKRADGQRKHGFQVVIRRGAHDAMLKHANSRTDVEVCGVLAGNLYRDHFGPYLLISAAIPGHAASQRGASVTFTAETWTSVMEKMESDHADRKMAGWYHTHPDFGVFLSDADVFIHRNFFDLPWQPAIVVDPVRQEIGNFVWRGGNPEREPWIIEEENATTNWRKIQQNGGTSGPTGKLGGFFSAVVTPVLFVLLVVALIAGLWLALYFLEF
ncbi:MAG: Mov34/MPN/PAD-1 family protein [Planctomycetota bacterium]